MMDEEFRFSDWALSRKVITALKRSSHSSAYTEHVMVRAKDGLVFLMGWVPSKAAKDACERVALTVPQVRRMYNELKVIGRMPDPLPSRIKTTA